MLYYVKEIAIIRILLTKACSYGILHVYHEGLVAGLFSSFFVHNFFLFFDTSAIFLLLELILLHFKSSQAFNFFTSLEFLSK